MPLSGFPLPVTFPAMPPVPARIADVPARAWRVTPPIAGTDPAPVPSPKFGPAPVPRPPASAEAGERNVTRATPLTWPEATVTAEAVPGRTAPPDHWSRYRPGAEQSVKCSVYLPGRSGAMTYRPLRLVIAIALPSGPDATTHAPVRGAPPAPSTNPVITPARAVPAGRPSGPPGRDPANAARILACAP